MAKNTYQLFEQMGDATQLQFLNSMDLYEQEPAAEDIRNFFGNSENFAVFSVCLSSYLKKGSSLSEQLTLLKQLNNEAKTEISEKTLQNWLTGKVNPQGNQNARDNMFKLCFMLGLDDAETARFFSHVYLAKPFHFRSVKECIYAFCLRKKLNYTKALDLLNQVNANIQKLEETPAINTSMLQTDVSLFEDENALVSYLTKNAGAFHPNSETALNTIKDLTDKCRGCIKNDRFMSAYEYKDNTIISEADILCAIFDENITAVAERKENKKTIKKNSYFTNTAKLNFPKKQEFIQILNNRTTQSLEAIRKLIILLHFYCFWCSCSDCSGDDTFDEYIFNINTLLSSAGYGELYFRNPYDGIFIYSSASHNPLDSFRDLFEAMFPTEE